MVSFSYMIRNREGEIVEYSDLPISYQHGGKHELFPQIEQALDGKQEGDEVTVELTSVQAFGEHDSSLTFTDDINNAPQELHFVGAELDAESESGKMLHFRVTEIKDGLITIDANHPLVGQDIVYTVTVTDVRDPSEEEKQELDLLH